MIFGCGIDLIEIARIERTSQSQRFCERVFTESELIETQKKSHRLAGFFAAKEALLKAMGTGLAGFSWQEIEIKHDQRGAPQIKVSGKIAVFLSERKISDIHLSISHAQQYAIAQVILEVGERNESCSGK